MAEPKEKPQADLTTAEAIKQLALAIKPQHVLEQQGLDQATIDRVTKAPEPRKYRMIPGKSEETGATFTLHVVESKKYPAGRIIALADYKHPAGMFTFQHDGGRVPDGFPMLRDAQSGSLGDHIENHQLSILYKQWRWEAFWQTDLRRIIGKEVTAAHCLHPDGMKTPWIEGKVGALRHDEPED